LFSKSKNIGQLSDLDIVQKYKQTGDKNYVGVLFERYGHLVYGVCLKYLKNTDNSKDAVMLIFEKLLVDLKKNEINNFKAWLHIVSKNHCLMKLRKESKLKNREQDIEAIEHSLTEVDSGEEPEVKEAQLTHLEEAIKLLKPEQQSCVELFYIKEKCYQEVADITGFTLKQVKSYIQNGKRNLKLILTTKNEFATR
jgi:RNA polymerase sigma factor (sigma-70 family)